MAQRLPTEILQKIFDHLPAAYGDFEGTKGAPGGRPDVLRDLRLVRRRILQEQHGRLTLVCRSFYLAAIERLYCEPTITGSNFEGFVRAVCPSINSHIRRNGLAEMIRVLDLTYLVHDSKKSLTARLLGRVKANVETFVAPRASFGPSCLAPLSKATRLQVLNLSYVSEAPCYVSLFERLRNLPNLRQLHIPAAYDPFKEPSPLRLDQDKDATGTLALPDSLTHLFITGNVPSTFLKAIMPIPQSLSHLWIGSQPKFSLSELGEFLRAIAPTLQELTIQNNWRSSGPTEYNMLHYLFEATLFPQLKHLDLWSSLFLKPLPYAFMAKQFVNHKLLAGHNLDGPRPSSQFPVLHTLTLSWDLDYSNIPNSEIYRAFTLIRVVTLHQILPAIERVRLHRHLTEKLKNKSSFNKAAMGLNAQLIEAAKSRSDDQFEDDDSTSCQKPGLIIYGLDP